MVHAVAFLFVALAGQCPFAVANLSATWHCRMDWHTDSRHHPMPRVGHLWPAKSKSLNNPSAIPKHPYFREC